MAKHEVKSPLPGTFYRKPSPEEPVFKDVGDAVKKGDVIGLVEVMKNFHEVKADADGTASAFPVGDAEAVTAGQTILELD